MTLSGGSRLGPYEILAPLGAGGMGEVYRAKEHMGAGLRMTGSSAMCAMVRTREEVLRTLEDRRQTLRAMGVRKLGLFGSVARGDAREESDLDFVVEFEAKSFDVYMNLKSFLEGLFECRVDLVLLDGIKPRLKPVILGEAVYAQGL